MVHERLDNQNFVLFAAKHYDNPHCVDTVEFYDDLKRFKYIKRLFGRYEERGELCERLILNHITVLYNVFGQEATRMLALKLESQLQFLKPFLVLMGQMPDRIENIGPQGKTIFSSDIPMDQGIIDVLRKI